MSGGITWQCNSWLRPGGCRGDDEIHGKAGGIKLISFFITYKFLWCILGRYTREKLVAFRPIYVFLKAQFRLLFFHSEAWWRSMPALLAQLGYSRLSSGRN